MLLTKPHTGARSSALARRAAEEGGGKKRPTRYPLCVLYWYKSTNTDAEGLLYWYKSTNTDAEDGCSNASRAAAAASLGGRGARCMRPDAKIPTHKHLLYWYKSTNADAAVAATLHARLQQHLEEEEARVKVLTQNKVLRCY